MSSGIGKRTVLLTGGRGFVGRALVRELLYREYDVVVATRKMEMVTTGSTSKHVTFLEVDYSDLGGLSALLDSVSPDYIVHLASGKNRNAIGNSCPQELLLDAELGLNLVFAAKSLTNLSRFIFVGTSDQYDFSGKSTANPLFPSPLNAYAFGKSVVALLLDRLYTEINFPFVQLVPSIIYGPGQGREMFIPALMESLLGGKTFETSPGAQSRDFLYIDDFVRAIIASLTDLPEGCNGNTYSVTSGACFTLKEVIDLVVESLGASPELVLLGAKPYRCYEKLSFYSDSSVFQKDSGWRPNVTLAEGLEKIISVDKHTKEAFQGENSTIFGL